MTVKVRGLLASRARIINSDVVSEKVVDIFDAVGLDKPNIGILDDAFLEDVRHWPNTIEID